MLATTEPHHDDDQPCSTSPTSSSSHLLDPVSLHLAVTGMVLDRRGEAAAVDALFREDAEVVRSLYREVAQRRVSPGAGSAYGRKREEWRRKKAAVKVGWRELSRRKHGLNLNDTAARLGLSRGTLVALLEHHGFLELVYWNGKQRRRLVSEETFDAGIGHNVIPDNRIGHLEGQHKAAPFPVFYEDRLDDIAWCLDWKGIEEGVVKQTSKRKRLAWLLDHHAYLPSEEIAGLVGCSLSAVEKAQRRMNSGSPSSPVTPTRTFEGADLLTCNSYPYF
jgi:hypothetical protein